MSTRVRWSTVALYVPLVVVALNGVGVADKRDALGVEQARADLEFDSVPLSIVEADCLDLAIAGERPGQAGGGVLAAGKQDERARRHGSNCTTLHAGSGVGVAVTVALGRRFYWV